MGWWEVRWRIYDLRRRQTDTTPIKNTITVKVLPFEFVLKQQHL